MTLRYHTSFKAFSTLWVLLVLFATPAWTAEKPVSPDSVTLFPGRALLECSESLSQTVLPDGQRGILVTLPANADPDTLRLSTRSGSPVDVRWERVPALDQGTVQAMRKELVSKRRDLAVMTGELQTIESRISLWSDTPADGAAAAEMERLDAAMSKHLATLYRTRFEVQEKQVALEAEVAALQEALDKAVGADRQVWQVQAALVNAPATVDVRYSYVLGGCNWQPLYRFEALPDQGKVAFTFTAEIEQSSGLDWKNAEVSLATVERFVSLVPPSLPEWRVEERQIMAYAASADAVSVERMAEEAPVMMKAAAPAPRKVERGNYAVWELGRKTIPAGRLVTLPVQAEYWRADFLYTARPSADSKAYLTAKSILPEPRELPRGTAMFLVDGALIGKRSYNLSGTDVDLFFGADPLVTATMKLLEKQSGDKGIIGRKQTMIWAWEMVLRNNRSHAVTLVAEDPEPQSGHSDIRIETESVPRPEKGDDHMLIWKTELAPKGESVIRHTVTVTAPRDMDVDYGRGR